MVEIFRLPKAAVDLLSIFFCCFFGFIFYTCTMDLLQFTFSIEKFRSRVTNIAHHLAQYSRETRLK